MSIEEQLVEKIVHLLSDHKAWYQSTGGKFIHVSGSYKIELEWGPSDITRIRWTHPESLVWHDSESCQGFPKIKGAIVKLRNDLQNDRFSFMVGYIDGKMTSNVIVGNPMQDDHLDRKTFPDYQWLYQQEGLGKWYWSPTTATFWFERKEDAVLYKTARYQP